MFPKLTIHDLYNDEKTQNATFPTAIGFQAEAYRGDQAAYWNVHGSDEHRY